MLIMLWSELSRISWISDWHKIPALVSVDQGSLEHSCQICSISGYLVSVRRSWVRALVT